MLLNNKRFFRFDGFRLYPTEHQLLRDEVAIPLAPKAFDILVYLVTHAGSLVKREELMQAVWPDSFVEETNLNVNISLLRKTLGTLPNGEPFIETVPRKGYRFNGPVTEEEDSGRTERWTLETPVHDVQLSPAVGVAAFAAAATAAAPQHPRPEVALPPGDVDTGPGPKWMPGTSISRVIILSLALLGPRAWSHRNAFQAQGPLQYGERFDPLDRDSSVSRAQP